MLLSRAVQRILPTQLTGSLSKTFADINSVQVRTKVRYHLPYPTETKRVRKQGFLKKVQTPYGRKELMIRMLRGDKVIAQ